MKRIQEVIDLILALFKLGLFIAGPYMVLRGSFFFEPGEPYMLPGGAIIWSMMVWGHKE